MRMLFVLIMIVLSLISIGACTDKKQTIAKPLKFYAAYWPGFMPMVLADELGYFKRENVSVEYVFTNNSSNLLMEFEAGAYDGAFLAFSSFVSSKQSDDFKVVMATDHSTTGDAVVVFPTVKTIKDLKGKKVASIPGAYGELFVTTMLSQNNMKPSDILWVQIGDENEGVKLFLDKKVEAIHLWEPYISKLVKAGAKPIFEAQSVPGLVVDALAIRNNTLKERSLEVKGFLKAWFAAVDYWKKNPKEAEELIAKKLKLSLEDVHMQGFVLYNVMDNYKKMQLGNDYTSLYYVGEMVINYLYDKNYIHKKNDVSEVIEPRFIEELK